MSLRVVCTSCGHLWARALLSQNGRDTCLICSGPVVDEEAVPDRPHEDPVELERRLR
jgi:hypothetical protein